MEGFKWQHGRDLLDPHHDANRCYAVHDRMPVIVDPDGYDLWLDPGMKDVATASELLKPCDAQLVRC